MTKQAMIFTWLDDTVMRDTGRLTQRNGVLVPEFERCPIAKAAVWSFDTERFDEGRKYAEKEGYQVHVLPDTGNILDTARQMAMAIKRLTTPEPVTGADL